MIMFLKCNLFRVGNLPAFFHHLWAVVVEECLAICYEEKGE